MRLFAILTLTVLGLISNAQVLTVTIDSTQQNLCSNDSGGSIHITTNGGIMPYQYIWSNGNTIEDINGLISATYTVTVTDSIGTSVVLSATVNSISMMQVSFQVSNESFAGAMDGVVQSAPNGGIVPYTFLWNNGTTNADINGVSAGKYTVTITDSIGCQLIDSTAVIVTTTPLSTNINILGQINCNGGGNGSLLASTFGGTSPYSFSWSSGSVSINSTGLSAGTYSVTVTDNVGATTIDSFNLGQPSIISIKDSVTDVLCFGGATGNIFINSSGGTGSLSFNWSNGGTTANYLNKVAGIYTITATDGNGCTATKTSNIIQPTTPFLVNTSVQDLQCFGDSSGSINTTSSGNAGVVGYSWSNGSSNSSIANLTIGIYSLTATDTNNCVVKKIDTIRQPPPVLTNISTSTSICGANGTVTANIFGGTPPFSILWENGDTAVSRVGLAAGIYSVTVTDNNGCTIQTFDSVRSVSSTLSATSISTNQSCNGAQFNDGAIVVTAILGTPPYRYLWNSGDTTSAIDSLAPAVYTVTITDSNNCQIMLTDTVEVGAAIPTVNLGPDTFMTSQGAVIIQADSGFQSYQWNTGASTNRISVKQSGTYIVTVTNGFGCPGIDSVFVNFIGVGVGALDSKEQFDLKVYPNPANDQLFIESNSDIISVGIISLQGKPGKMSTVKTSGSKKNLIDISELVKAHYILRVKTKNGIAFRRISITR